MSSALKQPVLPSTGNQNPTTPASGNVNNSSIGLNKNLPQSSTLPISSNTSVTTNRTTSSSISGMQLGGNATSISGNKNFPHNMSSTQPQPFASQQLSSSHSSTIASNTTSAHQQNAPSAAHQQTVSSHQNVQNLQQAVTAHQVHPQATQEMQQASIQFNKQVNCSNPTLGGSMPLPVNMVQDRTINIASIPPQSVPLPATTSANSSQSLSSSQNSSSSISQTSTSSTISVNSSNTGTTASSQTASTVSTSPQKASTPAGNADNTNSSNITVPVVSTTNKPSVQANGTIEPINQKSTTLINKDETNKEISTQSTGQANQGATTVQSSETKISKEIVKESIHDGKKETDVKTAEITKKEVISISSTSESIKSINSSTTSSITQQSITTSTTQVTQQVQKSTESVTISAVQANSSTTKQVQNNVTKNSPPKVEQQKTPTKSSPMNTKTVTPPTAVNTSTTTPTATAISTPRSANKRKRDSASKSPKSSVSEAPSPTKIAKVVDNVPSTPRSHKSPGSNKHNESQKSGKRVRVRTQPYQSPLPEIALITKLSTQNKGSPTSDEKLIAFYKNEFLAVRNAEGGFYVCQALQNVYKTSSKIKIRWLSNHDKSTDIYRPDFYDCTEFDCILTNLSLNKVDKTTFRLPKEELERTESILKRALNHEQGVEDPDSSLTEEHPDGLDLSLLRDENQLKKRKSGGSKAKKRKSGELKTETNEDGASPSKIAKSSRRSAKKSNNRVNTTPKAASIAKSSTPISSGKKSAKKVGRKTPIKPKKIPAKKVVSTPKPAVASTSKRATPNSNKKENSATVPRSQRYAARKSDNSLQTSPVVDAKKAKVLAKVAGRKSTSTSSSSASTPKVNVKQPQTSVKPAKANKSTPAAVTASRGTRSGGTTTNTPQTATTTTTASSSVAATTTSNRRISPKKRGKK